MILKRKNVNPNDYVQCCVIGCHGNTLLQFGFNTKVSCEGLLGGGGQIILKHLYLNYYAEFDSKISYIMFLYGYLLASEMSTIRTLALSCMLYSVLVGRFQWVLPLRQGKASYIYLRQTATEPTIS